MRAVLDQRDERAADPVSSASCSCVFSAASRRMRTRLPICCSQASAASVCMSSMNGDGAGGTGPRAPAAGVDTQRPKWWAEWRTVHPRSVAVHRTMGVPNNPRPPI